MNGVVPGNGKRKRSGEFGDKISTLQNIKNIVGHFDTTNPDSFPQQPHDPRTNTDTMPKSLEKTRKRISKKKGDITSLHENSRDALRLRRALMRDDKLIRVASARRKSDKHWRMVFCLLQCT